MRINNMESLNPEKISDEELVRLTLENKDNFYYILKRYEHKLLAFILRITSVRTEEAEDLLQEIFIKIYRNLNSFDTSLKFSSWAYRIARNHVISSHRKRKNEEPLDSIEYSKEISERLTLEINAADALDRESLKKDLLDAMSRINERYREALILQYFEEKDYKEISDILKVPMGTVATLIHRAKKSLKDEFVKSEKPVKESSDRKQSSL